MYKFHRSKDPLSSNAKPSLLDVGLLLISVLLLIMLAFGMVHYLEGQAKERVILQKILDLEQLAKENRR